MEEIERSRSTIFIPPNLSPNPTHDDCFLFFGGRQDDRETYTAFLHFISCCTCPMSLVDGQIDRCKYVTDLLVGCTFSRRIVCIEACNFRRISRFPTEKCIFPTGLIRLQMHTFLLLRPFLVDVGNLLLIYRIFPPSRIRRVATGRFLYICVAQAINSTHENLRVQELDEALKGSARHLLPLSSRKEAPWVWSTPAPNLLTTNAIKSQSVRLFKRACYDFRSVTGEF